MSDWAWIIVPLMVVMVAGGVGTLVYFGYAILNCLRTLRIAGISLGKVGLFAMGVFAVLVVAADNPIRLFGTDRGAGLFGAALVLFGGLGIWNAMRVTAPAAVIKVRPSMIGFGTGIAVVGLAHFAHWIF